MAKKVKVDVVLKEKVSAAIAELFADQGVEVIDGATELGMTAGTLVLRMAEMDVQVKLITPNAKNADKRYVAKEVE